MTVRLDGAQETLLIPLYGRAVHTRQGGRLLADPKAVEMVEQIDYDFTAFAGSRDPYGCVLRGAVIDHWATGFLCEHPAGTVVEVGVGLNTRFERLDNGTVHWVDLDLPDAMALRRRFFADTDRRRTIAASVLDQTWVEPVRALPGPYFVVAEASILYLSEPDALAALRLIATSLRPGRLALDTWGSWILTHQHSVATLRRMDAPLTWGCDDPGDLEHQVPGLALRESRRFGDLPASVRSRLPMSQRLGLGLVSRLALAARAYRLNSTSVPRPRRAPEADSRSPIRAYELRVS